MLRMYYKRYFVMDTLKNSEEEKFWNEAQKRRNIIFMWFLLWVPLYPFISNYIQAIYNGRYSVNSLIFLSIWIFVWLIFEIRIRQLVCPKCSLRAFRHCWFFMKNAECRHCGYSYLPELN
jgi:hypothetical protein